VIELVTITALVLRLAAGAIFVAQGTRKLLGPADAPHGRRALAEMIRREGMPAPERLALVVAAVELAGGIGLIAGLLTRLAAAALAFILIVAILGFKRRAGFLGGWDWPFSVLAIVSAILLLGAGAWSLDSILRVPV
jgi:putative oxidoreductase